jgi:hypothetical protein
MLTLQKDARATEIVEIHKRSTRSKKAHSTVYYSHSTRDKTSNVAPAAGVLALHKNSLKKVLKLSNADFDRLCVMIDTNEEPDVGEPLRAEYWDVHKVYERALRTEMYLGDQDDLYFEHNLPRDKRTWGGNFILVGNSGAGKTYWVVQLLLRYMRATKPHSRRTLIYVSPEWKIDKTVKRLKDKRYAFNVLGIDVSEEAAGSTWRPTSRRTCAKSSRSTGRRRSSCSTTLWMPRPGWSRCSGRCTSADCGRRGTRRPQSSRLCTPTRAAGTRARRSRA